MPAPIRAKRSATARRSRAAGACPYPGCRAAGCRLRSPLQRSSAHRSTSFSCGRSGAPGREELAVGAVFDDPAHETALTRGVLAMLGKVEADFTDAVAAKLAEIETRQ